MTAHRSALVRRPSPRLADGIVTHIDRTPVDPHLAQIQWHGVLTALHRSGWQTIEVPGAPECPDAVFVEDAAVMFGTLAVIAHSGAPARRAESAAVETVLRTHGYEIVAITAPGTLDGGDVLKTADRVYVGRGGRTNAEGVRQLRAALAPRGIPVTAVPLTKALHLKSAVTALPDGTIIGYTPVVDDPSFFPHYLAMPEEPGAHVVDLGGGRLLMSAAAPRSADLLTDLGYEIVPVDISEFEKLEGCVTCLSIRLRTAPAAATPRS